MPMFAAQPVWSTLLGMRKSTSVKCMYGFGLQGSRAFENPVLTCLVAFEKPEIAWFGWLRALFP